VPTLLAGANPASVRVPLVRNILAPVDRRFDLSIYQRRLCADPCATLIAEKLSENRNEPEDYFAARLRAGKRETNMVAFSESNGGPRMDPPAHQITQLLHAWSEGDQGALDQLIPLIYEDLHRLARHYMAQERPDHTLQATALVHEAYLRMLDSAKPSWQDRAHFLAVCARTMRHILVDLGRTHQVVRHGGDAPTVCLKEAIAVASGPGTDLVAVDDALTALAAVDLRNRDRWPVWAMMARSGTPAAAAAVARPARSEWPARSPASMPALAARRLMMRATDCAVSRRPTRCPCRLMPRNSGPSLEPRIAKLRARAPGRWPASIHIRHLGHHHVELIKPHVVRGQSRIGD